MPDVQMQKTFFDFNAPTCPYTQRQIEWTCSPFNSDCVLSNYVGNDHAVRRISRAGETGLMRFNHCISDVTLGFFGPSGVGKTELGRMLGKMLEIPFIEIAPQAFKTMGDLHQQIAKGLASQGWPLVEHRKIGHFLYPPCIVFFDEAHKLKRDLVEGGLLKAIEWKDRTLVTEKGIKANTYNVCWMVATTDRGKLFDALDTRFRKVELRCYTLDEMTKIIQINNRDWPLEACRLAARYQAKVPREAIDFAMDMRAEMRSRPKSWEAVARQIAVENSIEPLPENDDGTFRPLTLKRLSILKALGQYGPISKERLQPIAGCKKEELEKYVMPYLTEATDDQPPYVTVVGGKGTAITSAGVKVLEQRGLPYKDSCVAA